MTAKARRDDSGQWEASDASTRAALSLSRNRTYEQAAEDAGVTAVTIYRWRQIPEFNDLIADLKAERLAALTEEVTENELAMLRLWRDMVENRVPANDKRLDRIAAIVKDIHKDALTFTDAPESPPPARPSVAVQVNNFREQPESA